MSGQTVLAVVLAALPVLTCTVVFVRLAAKRRRADEALHEAIKTASKTAAPSQNPRAPE